MISILFNEDIYIKKYDLIFFLSIFENIEINNKIYRGSSVFDRPVHIFFGAAERADEVLYRRQ